MKKRLLYLSVSILCVCLLAGCASIVPVTDDIIDQVGGEDQLKNFQYYVSRSIILDRTDDQTAAGIVKGKANIVQKIEKNKVTIKRSTPGVVLRYRTIYNNTRYVLSVAFESDDNYFLEFTKYDDQRDSPYNLTVADNSRNLVGYGREIYQYSFPAKNSMRSWIGIGKEKQTDSAPPYLLIKLNKKMIRNVNKRVAKGRTLK